MYKFIGLVLRIHLSLNASYSATKQSALSNKSSIPYLALCKGFFNTIKLHLQVSSSIMNSKVHFTWSSNFHTDPRNLVTICRCFVWVAMLTVLYNSFPSIVPHACFLHGEEIWSDCDNSRHCWLSDKPVWFTAEVWWVLLLYSYLVTACQHAYMGGYAQIKVKWLRAYVL